MVALSTSKDTICFQGFPQLVGSRRQSEANHCLTFNLSWSIQQLARKDQDRSMAKRVGIPPAADFPHCKYMGIIQAPSLQAHAHRYACVHTDPELAIWQPSSTYMSCTHVYSIICRPVPRLIELVIHQQSRSSSGSWLGLLQPG